MMQHGQWNPHHMCHANCGCGHVQPMRQMPAVVCPTQYRCTDSFNPAVLPVIHPIVNVNRQNTVLIPRDYYAETTRNVPGETILAQPGHGPGHGRRGGFGRGPWR
jgi:hypothetical protein